MRLWKLRKRKEKRTQSNNSLYKRGIGEIPTTNSNVGSTVIKESRMKKKRMKKTTLFLKNDRAETKYKEQCRKQDW